MTLWVTSQYTYKLYTLPHSREYVLQIQSVRSNGFMHHVRDVVKICRTMHSGRIKGIGLGPYIYWSVYM